METLLTETSNVTMDKNTVSHEITETVETIIKVVVHSDGEQKKDTEIETHIETVLEKKVEDLVESALENVADVCGLSESTAKPIIDAISSIVEQEVVKAEEIVIEVGKSFLTKMLNFLKKHWCCAGADPKV